MRSLLLMLLLSLFAASAHAQSATPVPTPIPGNPNAAPCNLPAQGTITTSVKYTLKHDCTQTNYLEIRTANTPSVTLEIDGAGHTIYNSIDPNDPNYGHHFLIVDELGVNTYYNTDTTPSPNVKVIIKNVTFDGGGRLFRKSACDYGNRSGFCWTGVGISTEGTLEMENVTFTGGSGKWLDIQGTATLTNVLFKDSRISTFALLETLQGVLHVTKTGSVTLNNAVFRDIEQSPIVIKKGGRATATGCLSFIRVMTHRAKHSGLHSELGTWTDSSTRACSGKIGNDEDAVVPYSPAVLPCDLPAEAVIDEDSTYTLTQDCVCMKKFTVAPGVTVTINGNGKAIRACAGIQYYTGERLSRGRGAAFLIGGDGAHLKIIDAKIYGMQVRNFGGNFTLAKSIVANAPKVPIINYGWAYLLDSLFENNIGDSDSSVYYAHAYFGLGRAIFRDNVFRNNSPGDIVAYATGKGAAIILCGENVLEGSSAQDAVLPSFIVDQGYVSLGCGYAPPVPPTAKCQPEKIEPPIRKPVGAIGVIFHKQICPHVIEIWEVMPNSQGKFALKVSQNDIEAVSEGVVACSSNGRAAVRVGLTEPVRQKLTHSQAYQDASPRQARDILISMGPNVEGKVNHIVINSALNGSILGTVTTVTDEPPCQGSSLSDVLAAPAATPQPTPIPYAAPVSAQAAQADGSIIHVVRPGDTIWQIGIAYNVHPHAIITLNQLNQLKNRGHFIFPGQTLIIREAE